MKIKFTQRNISFSSGNDQINTICIQLKVAFKIRLSRG